VTALTQIDGVELAFNTPYFHEALLRLDQPVKDVMVQLAEAGIAGGFAPDDYYPELPNTLLVCATEMRTAKEIAHYAETLNSILKRGE